MRNSLYGSGLSGLGSALIAGFSEYAMTSGVSGWIPLIAGLIGATVVMMGSWIVGKIRSSSNGMTSEQRFELAKTAQAHRREFWSNEQGCFVILSLATLALLSLFIFGAWLGS